MKIDLHVHTLERSACAHASEEEQIEAAIDRGLDALVFTDHARLISHARLMALNQAYAPFRIFGGIEITVKEKEDVLVVGVHDSVLETRTWTYPELHAFVREREGWLGLAHPFRYHREIAIDIERYQPDALESCSTNIILPSRPHILKVAQELGIQMVCNSDAHVSQSIGIGYNVLKETPVDEADLVRLLRTGAFLGVCTVA